ERIDLVDDATGAVLDSRTLSDFGQGRYLVWNVTGSVTVRVTNLNGKSNAVLSGLFLGGVPTLPGSATFVAKDNATQGTWGGTYGADGYVLAGDDALYPSYARVGLSGQATYVWEASTTDPRGLQKAANPASRVAACWYSGNSFSIDLNLLDGQSHRVAAYFD